MVTEEATRDIMRAIGALEGHQQQTNERIRETYEHMTVRMHEMQGQMNERMHEMQAQMNERMREMQAQMNERMREMQAQTDVRMQETQAQTDVRMHEMSVQILEINRRLDKLIFSLFGVGGAIIAGMVAIGVKVFLG